MTVSSFQLKEMGSISYQIAGRFLVRLVYTIIQEI